MRPEPFQNGDWVSLRECFAFASSGLESKRDHIVYAVSRATLERQIRGVLSLEGEVRDVEFNSTKMNPAHRAQSVGWIERLVRLSGYRPLDRRWHYSDDAWNDRPRPALRSIWGANNTSLFSLPSGTNAGPAVWCFGDYPDRHAFRGSYGEYAFPLHDRRPNVNAPNISPKLIENLSAAYGQPVAAEAVFHAILCLLSAASYTLRFAEDLEDVFPHVPFPAQHGIFQDTVRVGREIAAIETFSQQPREPYRQPDFVRIVSQPRGAVAPVEYADSSITLCDDGTGRITGLPQSVWAFSVSGYRLLPRWLEARVGLPADHAFVRELRDICGRIAELIDLFARADIFLEATLHETLTREALGLDPIEQDTNDRSN
jgi:predicted helicase